MHEISNMQMAYVSDVENYFHILVPCVGNLTVPWIRTPVMSSFLYHEPKQAVAHYK